MTVLDIRIVTGHNDQPQTIFDVLHDGAVLPCSLTIAEFVAMADMDGTEPSPYIVGGEVYYPPAFVSSHDAEIPF